MLPHICQGGNPLAQPGEYSSGFREKPTCFQPMVTGKGLVDSRRKYLLCWSFLKKLLFTLQIPFSKSQTDALSFQAMLIRFPSKFAFVFSLVNVSFLLLSFQTLLSTYCPTTLPLIHIPQVKLTFRWENRCRQEDQLSPWSPQTALFLCTFFSSHLVPWKKLSSGSHPLLPVSAQSCDPWFSLFLSSVFPSLPKHSYRHTNAL